MQTPIFLMFKKHISTLFLIATIGAFLSSCQKAKDEHPGQPAFNYSSEVLDKWMTLQLRLMRNATGIPNQAFSRHFAYSGIAALESLAPGLPAAQQWSARLNGLTGLPQAQPSVKYYYPANVNAALASINRSMFPNASNTDKAAIDSLENALYASFLGTHTASQLNVSADYGKAVATAVFSWSQTDNSSHANDAYTVVPGPGLWKPTPPALANPSTPYWGNNRPVIAGSTANSSVPAPLTYSATPGSPFYNMVNDVFTASQNLTDDQKAMAMHWRDVPGVTSPGHWLSILQQVIRKEDAKLDKAALAYALTGAAVNDALISCFHEKYKHKLVRPVTYIREEMGHSAWNSYLGTPPHPEYPSAHSSLSAAAADVLQRLFGNPGSFTDHTYDYLGFGARTYTSYSAIAVEAGKSRLYAGIHYQPSIDAGIEQGKKVSANIFSIAGLR